MTTVDTLYVRWEGSLVGTWTRQQFCYAASWLERSDALPLSTSLPLAAEPYHEVAHRWFGNLLPEGNTRERVSRQFRVEVDDDFGLLSLLGRDCAGALSISGEVESAAESPAGYRVLTDDDIAELVEHPYRQTALFNEEARLSLAGAQDKVAIRFHDQQLWLPQDGAPSTHILKLPGFDAALVENEYFCLNLAAAIELDPVEARLWPTPKGPCLLVTRYDREAVPTESRTTPAPDPRSIRRIHQEDFAQALGVSRRQKYQEQGAPSLADCVALIRRNGLRPAVEILRLLRWMAFCTAIGNRDNHLKNLARSIAGQRWQLAPFYDLVNTTAYKNLSQTFALFVGNAKTMSKLSPKSWGEQADAMGLAPSVVLREVADVVSALEDSLSETSDRVANTLGDDAKLIQFRQAITKSMRATQRSIRST